MNGFDLIIKPDEEEPGAAEVLVDGTIGGRAYRFLLDTGAAMTRVKCDDYISAFDSVEKRETSGAFSKSNLDLIVVPEIRLGPILKTNFTVMRLPPTQNSRNLIGMSLLKDHSLFFDFTKNRVEVDAECPPEGAAACRELTLSSKSHPYIDVSFGGVNARAVWDTGAGMTVVDSQFVKDNPSLFRPINLSRGTDSAGVTRETPLMAMKAMTIGDTAFPAHKVAAVDLSLIKASTDVPMDLILGYNMMLHANWWFDFPGRKWAVINIQHPRS
jgi:predicted aspartyl protease